MTNISAIIEYASRHRVLTVEDVVFKLGIKRSTTRQLLSRLTLCGRLSRVGYGRYEMVKDRGPFPVYVPNNVSDVYARLHSVLPFNDFCVYSGSLLEPLQHHVSINHAIYVETNRESVDAVFALLKNEHEYVYCRPDERFMNDYVDLAKECIIVKPLVTESPVRDVNGVPSPMLEKLLVDMLKDPDFDYLHGAEYDYMIENAMSQYLISISRLMRYARRRGVQNTVKNKIDTITL